MKNLKTYWDTEQFNDNLWIDVEYLKMYYSVDSFDKEMEDVRKKLKHHPNSSEPTMELMKYILSEMREYYKSVDGEWIDDEPIYSTVTDSCGGILYEGLDYYDAEEWCFENEELFEEK